MSLCGLTVESLRSGVLLASGCELQPGSIVGAEFTLLQLQVGVVQHMKRRFIQESQFQNADVEHAQDADNVCARLERAGAALSAAARPECRPRMDSAMRFC